MIREYEAADYPVITTQLYFLTLRLIALFFQTWTDQRVHCCRGGEGCWSRSIHSTEVSISILRQCDLVLRWTWQWQKLYPLLGQYFYKRLRQI